MFASLKTSIAASLAALTFGIVLSAAPADANGLRMGGFGGFHGGFHGWHRHGWGPGFGFGVIPAGASCIVYQPVYDDAGNYLGRSPVNTCQ